MTLPIIPNRPFDHPAVWTVTDIGCKDTFAFDLDDRHIAAFETAVAGLRDRGQTAFEGIGRHDIPLDAIAEDVRAWRHEVADGRGLLLLRGFPVDRWSQEDTKLVWFGFGIHFGRAVSQSVLGDLLGHVVNVGGDDMRHLMRLWLMDWDGRPTVEGVRYHKGEGGIVPQGGKEPYHAKRNPAIDSAQRRGAAL